MLTTLALASMWSATHRVSFAWNEPGPATVALRLGFTPESLAAAGCSPAETDELLFAIGGAVDLTSLDIAEVEWQRQAAALAPLIEELRSEAGCTDEFAAKCAAEQEAFTALDSQLAAALDAARASALAVCPQEIASRLETLSAGLDAPGLPLRVFAAPLSQAQQEDLATAYAMERLSEQSGEELDPEFSALIAEVEGNAAVQQAQQLLDANLAGVEQAFDELK